MSGCTSRYFLLQSAARDDALIRALHHPGRPRIAPVQPEELLVPRLGLALKRVGPGPSQPTIRLLSSYQIISVEG
jgi:hypothetical protein